MAQDSKVKKTGRPKLDIDPEQVEQLASFNCTNTEIAAFFNCDEGTIRKRFSENITKGREMSKMRLRKLQFEAAARGNVAMLIWLGKQYLGQKDKAEIDWDHHIEEVKFIEV